MRPAQYHTSGHASMLPKSPANESIIQLWNDGLTVGQITEQLGCSGQDVFTVLSPIIKAATYGL